MPVLEEIYNRPSSDLDDGLGILLAWACTETGQWQQAEPLLRVNPLPQAPALGTFSSLLFPRLFFCEARCSINRGSAKKRRATTGCS